MQFKENEHELPGQDVELIREGKSLTAADNKRTLFSYFPYSGVVNARFTIVG